MRNFSLGTFQASILLFSQALTVQVLFYPLVIFNIIRHLPSALTNKKIILGFFLIFFALISILMRGASIEMTILLVRFYCGIILVSTAFTISKNVQITRMLFWIFALFVFYEYISLMIGVTPFTYVNFVNAGIESEISGRVSLGNNVMRAVGPTMNSSASGSILAIMFFYILIGNNKFLLFKSKTLLLVGLLMAFVLTGSMTAMIVFIFLLLAYVTSNRRPSIERFNSNFLLRLTIIFLVLLIFTIISSYIFSDYLDGVIAVKWNWRYLMEGIDYKLFQISVLNNLQTVLFGADLTDSTVESAGGDFIMLSFVYHFGLIYVSAFIAYLFYICKSENRVFLFAALLSSIHYGTLFTLTGQVFFGALIVGSVCTKEFLQCRSKLCDLKIVKPRRLSLVEQAKQNQMHT